MASWLGSGRPGRVLAGTLNALLRRARSEAPRREPPEPTAYLALLAVRSLSHGALSVLKEFPISGPAGRMLQGAVAAGLCWRCGSRRGKPARWARSGGAQCEAASGALPGSAASSRSGAAASSCYGVAFTERPPRLDQHVQKIAQGGTVEVVAGDVAADLVANKESMRKAARQVALARLAPTCSRWCGCRSWAACRPFSVEGFSLAQLYQAPGRAGAGALRAALAQGAVREDARGGQGGDQRAGARGHRGGRARPPRPGRKRTRRRSLPHEQVITTWARTVAALAADAALDAAVNQAEGQLVHRQGNESEGGIETQHESGKLYLVTVEEKPILKMRTRAPQMGHLFCDMKDFTRRTAFLKETVIADFLSREFYGPILTAAARHAQGAAHLADKGGIYLNNLLGDAVSFSGDIVALLELAEEIRVALGSYARRLDSGGSSEAVAKAIAAIEQQFQARKQKLEAAVKSARDGAAPRHARSRSPEWSRRRGCVRWRRRCAA